MGLFGRRWETPAEIDADTVSMARDALAASGVAAEIQGAGTPDVALATDRGLLPLYNLIALARMADRRDRRALVERHLRIALGTGDLPAPASLPVDELRRRVRTRLLPVDAGGPITTRYQRPFGPGLAVVLGLDYEESVQTLGDEAVATLPLPLDELFAIGAANVAGEPIDSRGEPVPGVVVIEGESMFVASKAVDMPSLLAAEGVAAPLGIVFSVPYRHALLYTVLSGPESLAAIQSLFGVTVQIASGEVHAIPGGPVDDGIWFWRDGSLQRVGGRQEDGSPGIEVEGAFQVALEELAGS